MNNTQYFDFEEKEDFPFYKDMKLTSRNTQILAISVILFIILVFIPVRFQGHQQEAIFCLAALIPFLVATRGNFGYLFKKPKPADIKTILIGLIGYFFVLFVFAFILTIFGIPMIETGSNITNQADIWTIIFEFIQIIGEEIFEIMTFLFLMAILNIFLTNRKIMIVVATFLTLIIFGLMHINSYSNIIYCIIWIGLGSVMSFYPYLKSKNVLLTIIVHFLYNMIVIMVYNI